MLRHVRDDDTLHISLGTAGQLEMPIPNKGPSTDITRTLGFYIGNCCHGSRTLGFYINGRYRIAIMVWATYIPCLCTWTWQMQ